MQNDGIQTETLLYVLLFFINGNPSFPIFPGFLRWGRSSSQSWRSSGRKSRAHMCSKALSASLWGSSSSALRCTQWKISKRLSSLCRYTMQQLLQCSTLFDKQCTQLYKKISLSLMVFQKDLKYCYMFIGVCSVFLGGER